MVHRGFSTVQLHQLSTSHIRVLTDCAPYVEDLFIFSYEFEFMKSLISTVFSVAAMPADILMTCLHSTTLIFKHTYTRFIKHLGYFNHI